MTTAPRTLYTGKVHVAGGREGVARSADGRLDIRLSTPGGPGTGTNPEQLLAAGWSACFEGAIAIAAKQMKLALPEAPAIDAEIDLNVDDDGYGLAARLNVVLPGLPRDMAQAIVEAAHRTCPYSKALAGNIDIAINIV
ncbi:organic hydroperoxide resistance protein [Caulobacter sp. LARHSG274]